MVLRDTALAETPKYPIESLVDAYYRGYKERFDDYFDTSKARKFGYEYGLQWDPLVHPMPRPGENQAMLAGLEENLRGRFQLDRPCWELFVKAFCEGFHDSYAVTREGTTAAPGERILLRLELFSK